MGLLTFGGVANLSAKIKDKIATTSQTELNISGRTAQVINGQPFGWQMDVNPVGGAEETETYVATEDFVLTGIDIERSYFATGDASFLFSLNYYMGTTSGADISGGIDYLDGASHAPLEGSYIANKFITIPSWFIKRGTYFVLFGNSSPNVDNSFVSATLIGYKIIN